MRKRKVRVGSVVQLDESLSLSNPIIVIMDTDNASIGLVKGDMLVLGGQEQRLIDGGLWPERLGVFETDAGYVVDVIKQQLETRRYLGSVVHVLNPQETENEYGILDAAIIA